MRDFYEVLEVSRDASPADLKKAYRRLAMQHHPDKNPGDKAAEERFKEATHAYDVLSDPAKRQRYDRFGAAGVGGGSAEDMGRGFAQNVGDVFSDLFGDFLGRRGPREQARGRDRTVVLAIDFATAMQGGERTLEVPRTEGCQTCAGSGAQPGTTPEVCGACGGTGEVRVTQGVFSVAKRCTFCRGEGRIIKSPCTTCGGRGKQERQAQLVVNVPKGADTGTVLRYAGAGEAGTGGGRPGDLRVQLQVAPHPVFKRDGADLHLEVPITLAEAALGGAIEVPTLAGRVRMKVPAGTQTGRTFRLRGKGAPRLGGAAVGDLHATVVIETPQALGPAEAALLEALRSLDKPAHYPRRAALFDGT